MPFLKKIVFFIALCALINRVSAQTYNSERYQASIFPSVISVLNVEYGTAPQWIWPYWNVDLDCDIYMPDGDDNTKRPLIIFAHAGGFLNGSKEVDNMVAICDSFARKGFVTVSIDYRKGFDPLDGASSERAVYRGIQDGKAAVRFFKENAAVYDIDTNAIFFGGMSAGGFISLYVGSMDKESERPASTYGGGLVNDLECLDCAGNSFPHSSSVRGILDYWGGIDDTLLMEPGDVPILIMHGENDPTVPFVYDHPFGLFTLPETYGGQPIKERSESIGREYTFVTSEGSLHMLDGSNNGTFDDPPNSFWGDTLLPQTMYFLREILQPTPDKISADSQTICLNTIVDFNVTDSSASTYIWEFDDVLINEVLNDSSSQLSLEFNNTGSFEISVIEYDQLLYPSDTLVFWVEVMPEVIAGFSAIQNVNELTFTNTSTSGTTFYWEFGDGGTSTDEDPVHVYADDGVYEVMLVAFDGNGCSDTTYQSFTVVNAGTNEFNLEFSVYPNPFSEQFQIEVNEETQVSISDGFGRVVYAGIISENTAIPASNWATGIYFVQLYSESKSLEVLKIIKQ